MAKVNFGLIISEARGRAGEVVYSRNRGGAYIRKTPYYVQEITTDVAAVRAIMKTIGALWWTTLTDQQRAAWRAFGQKFAWKDCLGTRNTPSGSAIFTQANFNIVNAGGSPILDPPDSYSAQDPGPLDCQATPPATLTVNPTIPLPPNHAPILRATECLKPGWTFFNRFLRQLGRNGSPVVPVTLPAAGPAWAAKFGEMTPGWKIGVGLQYVNLLTGAISPMQTQLVTVQPVADAMLQFTIEITAAQLLTSDTNPITLLPQPPTGKAYLILGIIDSFHFHTTQYTGSSALAVRMPANSSNYGLASLVDLTTLTADYAECWTPPWTSNPTTDDASPPFSTSYLELINSTEGSLATGDGTLTVTILYAIVPITSA
jgi:hypothetical protein